MDENRFRKLAGLNEATELKEDNESIIQDIEKKAEGRVKQLESQLEKVLRAASLIGAELSVIELGRDFALDALADGTTDKRQEALKVMMRHARNTVDDNKDFFIETFGDRFRFMVEGLVEGEKVKPKV